MIDDTEMNASLNKIQTILDDVNSYYITSIAEQIRKIGKLSQTSINRLTIMAETTSNVTEVYKRLQKATGLCEDEISKLFKRAMQETYTDKRFIDAYSQGVTPPSGIKDSLKHYTELVYHSTQGRVENLSNTTIVDRTYHDAIDKAIVAVSTGLGDYQSAIRNVLRQIGSGGIIVEYPSGYKRRLDTAVRQNVIDGTKLITQEGANSIGRALGYDAVELSAHMHSAPDHEPVQGRVFLIAEFDKMQIGADFEDWKGNQYAGFRRPIGLWNCMHIAMPFSTRFSKPRYTEEELQSWEEANAQGIGWHGRHLTIYQASQLMRGMETEMRGLKGVALAAKAAGDDLLRRETQWRINELQKQYETLAQRAALAQQKERMAVAGYRPVKAVEPQRKPRRAN